MIHQIQLLKLLKSNYEVGMSGLSKNLRQYEQMISGTVRENVMNV